MLVGQRKKSQKYFDLSTFNYNLYDSNPCSSLGVMNFQKWELFSGSPGRPYQLKINCFYLKNTLVNWKYKVVHLKNTNLVLI